MNIHFPAEIEQALRRRANATGQNVEAMVTQIVTDEVFDEVQRQPTRRLSVEEFARRSEEWIRLHPVFDHVADDSRESIYAGCGE